MRESGSTELEDRRVRRGLNTAVVVVGLVLLAGCNPLNQKPHISGSGSANASVTYHGPAEAWLQVQIAGTEGFGVKFRAGVPSTPPRTCAEAMSGEPRPCQVAGDYLASAWHYTENDDPYTYWPTVRIRPGEWASVLVACSYGTRPIQCPDTTAVVTRVVDDGGNVIGDLSNGIPN